MVTWMLSLGDIKNEQTDTSINPNIESYPNTVDPHTYPINPNNPSNPNYKPHRTNISNMVRNARNSYKDVENRQIGYNTTNNSNMDEEMIKGMISNEVQNSMKSMQKMFEKMKKRMDDMDEDSNKGFANVTEKGLEGCELFKNLPKLGKKAVKVLKNPPETWEEYMEDDEPDFESIYKMEVKELMESIKKCKSEGKKSVDKELTHVMASLLGMMIEECLEDK